MVETIDVAANIGITFKDFVFLSESRHQRKNLHTCTHTQSTCVQRWNTHRDRETVTEKMRERRRMKGDRG